MNRQTDRQTSQTSQTSQIDGEEKTVNRTHRQKVGTIDRWTYCVTGTYTPLQNTTQYLINLFGDNTILD